MQAAQETVCMFTFLGRLATQHPWKILTAWLLLGVGLTFIAPRWEQTAQDDDIRFLPGRCDSVKGYRLLEQAFPGDVYASRVIFALEREGGRLTPHDLNLANQIVADLNRLSEQEPALKIGRIHSYQDAFVGKRLLSKDQRCLLIQVSLGTPYLAFQTRTSVERAEEVVRQCLSKAGPDVPELYVTGPAGVGRDLTSASASSLDRTTLATILLVVVILLCVYRAPLLAVVPLITIGVSVWVALSILSLCTLIPGFYLVNVSQIFAVVMLYGAGTDYCLFLISRYREEMSEGKLLTHALGSSVGKVGSALAASAGTVICGLGLMGLAEFAKVRCGGPAIALSLAVALAASLTLTPALLRLLGRGAFWPVGVPQPRQRTRLSRPQVQTDVWSRVSRFVAVHPLLIGTTAVLVLAPLAFLGFQVKPNYRATGELSQSSSSVLGLKVIQRHFTAGETGPVSILLTSHTNWEKPEARAILAHLSQGLTRLENVAEVRSLTQPLGEPLQPAAVGATSSADTTPRWLRNLKKGWANTIEEQTRLAARQFYLASVPQPIEDVAWLTEPASIAGPMYVTRLDVVLNTDPFDPHSVPTLDVIQAWLKLELPNQVKALDGFQAETYGVTVSSRDLALVTEHDRARINVLVLGGIFLILLVLVRKLWLASYLLLTVLFSYYATLGATTLLATWWSGRPLGEVDWRVPFFLFTILVAVGEDYNILLISRALKERRRFGGVEGMRRALARTGGTITSCGLIMAGTFATLMLSGLNTLVQIGFALAFGVLLDTFVVRPFLVPAFTMLVWRNEKPPEEEPVILPMPKRRKQHAA
jgi:RND superfamily putative drug exporter